MCLSGGGSKRDRRKHPGSRKLAAGMGELWELHSAISSREPRNEDSSEIARQLLAALIARELKRSIGGAGESVESGSSPSSSKATEQDKSDGTKDRGSHG